MTQANRLHRIVSRLDSLPGPLRRRALSLVFGRLVKFVGTAGLSVEDLSTDTCVVSTPNRARVQNHIGGVHAAAMALLAETATGLVVGMNVPDDAVPVIKSLHVDYRKRSKGGMRAVASLTEAQRERMRTEPKGDVSVHVVVSDASGEAPIDCEMVWAWVPKKRD